MDIQTTIIWGTFFAVMLLLFPVIRVVFSFIFNSEYREAFMQNIVEWASKDKK